MKGLVGLGLRRSLPAALLVPYLLVMAIASTRGFEPPRLVTQESRDALAAGALARQGCWSVFWILAGPACLFRAAGFLRAWRRRDADWQAPLPIGGLVPISCAWLGNLLGGLLLILCAAAGAEWAGRTDGALPSHRWVRDLEHPTAVLFPGDAPLVWTAGELALLGALPRGPCSVPYPRSWPARGRRWT